MSDAVDQIAKPARITSALAGQLRITSDRRDDLGHWRTVNEGEIFPPGGHYRINLGGGSEVWVPGGSRSNGL